MDLEDDEAISQSQIRRAHEVPKHKHTWMIAVLTALLLFSFEINVFDEDGNVVEVAGDSNEDNILTYRKADVFQLTRFATN